MKSTLIFKQIKKSLYKQFGTTVSYKSLKSTLLVLAIDANNPKNVTYDQQLLGLMAWFLLQPDLSKLRDWVVLRKLFFKHHGAELMKLLDDQYVDSTQLKRIPVLDYLGLIDLFLQFRHSDALRGVSYIQLAHIIVRCFDVSYSVKGVKNTLCARNLT